MWVEQRDREESKHGAFELVQIIHDICPLFSTDTIFGSIFLHTKAHKSRQKNPDKTA